MRDIDSLRGEGSSQYNSSLDILMRINRLIEFAETSSFIEGIDGLTQWKKALSSLEREVKPYLDEREINELKELRVNLPDAHTVRKMRVAINEQHIRERLELWEDKIRYYIAKKGMGLKAGRNIRTAIAGGG